MCPVHSHALVQEDGAYRCSTSGVLYVKVRTAGATRLVPVT